MKETVIVIIYAILIFWIGFDLGMNHENFLEKQIADSRTKYDQCEEIVKGGPPTGMSYLYAEVYDDCMNTLKKIRP